MQTLSFVKGSTVKLEQLLGEEDKERRQPTRSLTFTRYKISGTDLGQSIEHQGRVYFFFGDTVGALGGALDTMATTDAADPEQGARLDFLTAPGKPYLTIQPSGLTMAGFETPNEVHIGELAAGEQILKIILKTSDRFRVCVDPCACPSSCGALCLDQVLCGIDLRKPSLYSLLL